MCPQGEIGVFPTACGCVPLSASPAFEHVSSSPQLGVGYKLDKSALISSCSSPIKVWKRTGFGTDPCSTLLDGAFRCSVTPTPSPTIQLGLLTHLVAIIQTAL